MNEYNQYCDAQVNQEELNEDIDMAPKSELNNHLLHSLVEALDNQDHQLNKNLTEINSSPKYSSLNKKQSNQEEKINENQSTSKKECSQNEVQVEDENDFPMNLVPNYGADDELNFYQDFSQVQVNQSLSCYTYTEEQVSETAEVHSQQTHVLSLTENTLDDTVKKES